MKTLLILLIVFSISNANQYTFLVDSYDKEVELEAKIITKIAKASTDKEIKLFIPKISRQKRVFIQNLLLWSMTVKERTLYLSTKR